MPPGGRSRRRACAPLASHRIRAYKEAERRAPAQDRAETRPARMAHKSWGHPRRRTVLRAERGRDRLPVASYAIPRRHRGGLVLACSRRAAPSDGPVLDKAAWQTASVAPVEPGAVHASILHLAFNMYFLYLVGARGAALRHARFVSYLLTACHGVAGELSDRRTESQRRRVRRAVRAVRRAADRARAHRRCSQAGTMRSEPDRPLVVINLVLGSPETGRGGIDNAAHVGGLARRAMAGLLIRPAGVAELPLVGRRPGGGCPAPGRTRRVPASAGPGRGPARGDRGSRGLGVALARWGVAGARRVVVVGVVAGAGQYH